MRGLVTSTDGAPIPGAEVRLTVLGSMDVEWEAAWYGDEWGPLERDTVTASTDAQGRFTLDVVANAPAGVVVWASHEEHEAACRVLEGTSESWPKPVTLVLQPTPILEALVLDANGNPAAGALVEQFGITPGDSTKAFGHVGAEQARRMFAAAREAGADGTVRLGALPGEQVLVASLGDRRSLPWRGKRQDRVVLRLCPTFELAGTVHTPSWEHLNYVGERRITVAFQRRNLWRTLHTMRSVENGSFGPITLPIVDADRYRVRLEGSPIIPAEAFLDAPRPGTRETVTLETDIGVNVWFRVTDENDEVIPEAVVKVSWQDPANPEHWNFAERSGSDFGQVNVWSLPPGTMLYEVHAEGYVPFHSSLTATSEYETGYAPIVLQRAGHLTGQVLVDGTPVRDFEVVAWPQIGVSPATTAFFDREDGRFALDTVPEGTFYVTASTATAPGGDPLQVTCPAGGSIDVVLDLPSGFVGRGQVVDEASGKPIADSSIQMFVPADPVVIARWGLPFPTDRDGVFELDGFRRGSNFVRALAPGYSNQVASQVLGPAAEELDFGTIAMARVQDLCIVLEREDPSLAVEVSAQGTTSLPTRRFEHEDTVVYPGISAGHYFLRFVDADLNDTSVEVDLVAGDEWVLRERVQGPGRLTIECRQPDGRPYRERFEAIAAYTSSQGYRHQRRGLTDTGVATIEGIDADAVSVRIIGGGAEIASTGGRFENGQLHLVATIDDEPFDLRVVDAEGEPLASVRVLVVDPENPAATVFGNTAENGECRLVGVPSRPVRVHLQHAIGNHFGIPVDASTRASELVLDPDASIELVFQDGDVALKGVACAITDPGMKTRLSGEATSDDSGHLVMAHLAPDEYPIQAWRTDCWPVETRVRARSEASPERIEMRRLTDMVVEVLTAGGVPVSGVAVDLVSIDLDESAAQWMAQGRLPERELVTGPDGRLRLERIPHGAYRWSVDDLGGRRRQGTFVAELGATLPLRITLE